ncbi:MAG TPA: non-canonical purine NTP pyrophosphatase [Opitutaceae bacterium]|nr:non-canonical purine NTP pyrophosphatase [Opitutaceae bacterium]
MKLYLATANANKAAEFRALADSVGAGRARIEIGSAAEVGGMPAVVEDAGTFSGNAGKKARALRERLPAGSWALADDSGLCVEALGGAPGVESAHFAGPQADPAANLAKLVDALRGVPEGRRAAEFVCVLALSGPGGLERLFEGRCAGRLIREPRGRGGFGYDPLFVPDGCETTLAEMPAAQKNRVGHRGRAWAECAAWLAARV